MTESALEKLDEIASPLSHEVRFAALDLVGEAVIVVDDQALILYVNDQAQMMLGYGRDELKGAHVEQLLPESVRSVHVAHRTHYLENPVRRPMGTGIDLKARHKSGRLIAVDINLLPHFWPGLGIVVGALITRKQAANASPVTN